jgi:hypothetical protein
MPSESAEQVKEKERIYRRAFEPVREPFVRVADLWCGAFFIEGGDDITPENYQIVLDALTTPARFRELAAEPWFVHAVAAARAQDANAFHWELEFPEVFFDRNRRNLDGGFHAVIGNPPYDVLAEKELGHDISAFVAFLKAQQEYKPSFRGKNNLYKLFICRGFSLLAEGGRLGFITPMAVLGDDQAAEIRKEILRVGAFTSVDAFPQKDDPECRVFLEAKLSTTVITMVKSRDGVVRAAPFVSRVHPAQYFDDGSPRLTLSTDSIPLYDPSNLSIVSCSQDDWDLAVKITSSGRSSPLKQFAEFFQGEVNQTNEMGKGNLLTGPAEGGQLVTRGANICLYVCREASQGTDLFLNVPRFLENKGQDTKAHHHRYPRVGLQETSPQNNFRRIIAALVPAGQFCNHKVNYLPANTSKLPIEFILGLLNSKLADWYFRLGSTNAAVSHYQLYNLPCPVFAETIRKADSQAQGAATRAVVAGDIPGAFQIVLPLLSKTPFSLVVRGVIVECVNRICAIETVRGEIARSARSHLAPEAQPYQDFVDRLFYAMAGLTDEESHALEVRLARML